jgi:hypothetical protein
MPDCLVAKHHPNDVLQTRQLTTQKDLLGEYMLLGRVNIYEKEKLFSANAKHRHRSQVSVGPRQQVMSNHPEFDPE